MEKQFENLIKLFCENSGIKWKGRNIENDLIKDKDFIVKAFIEFDLKLYIGEKFEINYFTNLKEKVQEKIIFFDFYNDIISNVDELFWIMVYDINSKNYLFYYFDEKYNNSDVIKGIIVKDKNFSNFDIETIFSNFLIKDATFFNEDILLSDGKKIRIKLDNYKTEIISTKNNINYFNKPIDLLTYISGIDDGLEKSSINLLMSKNVRGFLGINEGKPSEEIIKTIFNSNECTNFFLYNNGVVGIADNYDVLVDKKDYAKQSTLLKGFSVINGGQTTAIIYKIYNIIRNKSFYSSQESKYIIYLGLFKDVLEDNKDIIEDNKNNIGDFEIEEFVGIFLSQIKDNIEYITNSELTLNIDNSEYKKILKDIFTSKKTVSGNTKYYSYIKKFFNGGILNGIIDVFIKENEEKIMFYLSNNLSKSYITLKVMLGLDSELINKVALYNNFQNRVIERDLFSSSLEVKFVKDYINKKYTKINFYDKNAEIINTDDKININLDTFTQISFVYLSTIENNGFLNTGKEGPSYAKNYKADLYLDLAKRTKIFDFDIETGSLEIRIFYVLVFQYMSNRIRDIINQINLKDGGNTKLVFTNSANLFHLIYMLSFEKIHEKIINLNDFIINFSYDINSEQNLEINIFIQNVINKFIDTNLLDSGIIKLYRKTESDKVIKSLYGFSTQDKEKVSDLFDF